MGWKAEERKEEAEANRRRREADRDRHRREREGDRSRHRAEAEAGRERRRAEADTAHQRAEAARMAQEMERERHQLEELRMKALAEHAKGQRGVWTAEYEGRLAAIRQREEAAAWAAAEARRWADEKRARDAATYRVIGYVFLALLVFGGGSCLVLGIIGQFVDPPSKSHPVKVAPKVKK